MGRLFAFGCSFTKYAWPTWADMIALDQNADYYNLGIAGLGNVGIASRIIEADAKFKFTADDKILILWTGFERIDWITNSEWENYGSVFHAPKDRRGWHVKNWSLSNDIVRNFTAIVSTNKIYKDLILWQGHSFDPVLAEHELQHMEIPEYEYNKAISYAKLFESQLPDIPVCIFDDFKPAFKIVDDIHPDVETHRELLQKYLDYDLSDNALNKINLLQNTIEQKCLAENIKDTQKVQHWIESIINTDARFVDFKNLFRHYSLGDYIC